MELTAGVFLIMIVAAETAGASFSAPSAVPNMVFDKTRFSNLEYCMTANKILDKEKNAGGWRSPALYITACIEVK